MHALPPRDDAAAAATTPARRDTLRLMALAGLGLAMPKARAAGRTEPAGAGMLALSAYMAEAGGRALPAEAMEQAKFHIIDTFAAIISGAELPPGKAALRHLRERAPKGPRTVAASRITAGATDAAMANGVMGHADETDDSHGRSRSHPGCAVVPAALAAAEEFGVDGNRFLRAVTLGYDVGTRVVMAMGGPAFSYESHKSSHAIAGVFGAAAAAACAAGLDAQRMRWVLDYTAQQSSGIAAWRRDIDHIEKAFVFGGMPARNGVTSALVVKSGWTGIDDIFTGDDNFFLAYAPDGERARLTEKLGERYEIALTDIKKWTVGSPIQGPLDALELMRGKRAFEADQVLRVTVRLEPSVANVVDNRDIPDICLQHMLAVMLEDKTVSFKAAHDTARMRSAATLRQRAKVELVRDESLKQFLPVRVALVEVALSDGTLLAERVEAVRGTPRNPMTRREVEDKARDLIAPVLGSAKAARLIDTVFAIEGVADMRRLRALLQRG
jgi:2-methylcitrate dehydratase PrpD